MSVPGRNSSSKTPSNRRQGFLEAAGAFEAGNTGVLAVDQDAFWRAGQARVAADRAAQMQLTVWVREGFGEVELPHRAEPGKQ